MAARVRIGIVNIMPKLETYEPLLLGPLLRVRREVEAVFIRLASHGYASSDHDHLERHYRSFDAAVGDRALDGLIVTGAPVEELPFEDVHYWRELTGIFAYAREHIASTLGLCWGGMAIAGALGLRKIVHRKKLFGVYSHTRLADTPALAGQPGEFWCAHSRHAGFEDAELERAANRGELRLLAHGSDTGYVMFETPDRRLIAHLGHPEYIAERLAFEWERDRALGRTDVDPPANFDPLRPITLWHEHREALFDRWVDSLVPA